MITPFTLLGSTWARLVLAGPTSELGMLSGQGRFRKEGVPLGNLWLSCRGSSLRAPPPTWTRPGLCSLCAASHPLGLGLGPLCGTPALTFRSGARRPQEPAEPRGEGRRGESSALELGAPLPGSQGSASFLDALLGPGKPACLLAERGGERAKSGKPGRARASK